MAAPRLPAKKPIYRWGSSNPAMRRAASPRVTKGLPFSASAFTYSPGKTTPGGLPALPAPAAAPAAPAGPTPLPLDPQYDATEAGLRRTRDDTLAGLSGQRTQTLGAYGYSAQYNPDGSVASLAFDPNNPFSRAALARTRYQQSKTGTQNSMASRGSLYAGSLQQAQGINDTNFNQNEDQLQKQLGAALAGILGQERSAKSTYESGIGQAGADRITRAGDSPLYSPQGSSPPAASKPNPLIPGQSLGTGFAGLDPSKRYRQASNGRLQIQNANGTWRYA